MFIFAIIKINQIFKFTKKKGEKENQRKIQFLKGGIFLITSTKTKHKKNWRK